MARTKGSKLHWMSLRKLLHSSLPDNLAKYYVGTLQHWYDNKGPEWTAARLKALWNCALLLRSGDRGSIPLVCRNARIAVANGLPKGIEGDLVQRWSKIVSPSKLRRMSVAFRAYTSIVLDETSDQQIRKSKQSITEPGMVPDTVPYTSAEWHEISRNKISGGPPSDLDSRVVTLLPFKSRPKEGSIRLGSLGELSGTSSYPHLFSIPSKDRKGQPFLSLMASLASKGKVPRPLTEALGDFEFRQVAEAVQMEAGDDTYGKIVVLQEGGAKGRTICSPNAWVQYYLRPYHKHLMNVVARLETNVEKDRHLKYGSSCVLDQVHGVYIALNRLNSGSYCHAVDLSSATDRFPLKLQLDLLEEIGIPEMGEALKELRGPYVGPDGNKWSYAAGQPMGLLGSFPLFHITHFALLNGLAHRLGLPVDVENFVVLGDDVLIFDERLLHLYLTTLEGWEVPISWHKSYKGNLVEFAGFVITKTKHQWTAFRPYKMGPNGNINSVLNTLHAFGVTASKWSRNWSERYALYQKTVGSRSLDLSPLIPEADDTLTGGGLPGVEWLDSVVGKLLFYPLPDQFPPEQYQKIGAAWWENRFRLCQTQIPEGDPYYVGEIQPTDRSYVRTEFHPKQYVQEDRLKKTIYQNFWSDRLVREALSQGPVRGE
uniref:RNA-dependent RNA polymerase n=1 Tax=Xiangxi Narna tick virus 1 TaxID=2972249 RepID=A0A9E7V1Y2_9VIRU|nr:MAG: RNA-dependent RNA polymerase [Xiangxi Narna tick virus 1]